MQLNSKAAEPLLWHERKYAECGFDFVSITVYRSRPRSIETVIADCVPANYGTPEACARERTRYEQMRADHVREIVETSLSTPRVVFGWPVRPASPEPCSRTTYGEANIVLRRRASELATDLVLLREIENRLKRVEPHHEWRSPDALRSALRRSAHDQEIFVHGSEDLRFELVTYQLLAPTRTHSHDFGAASSQQSDTQH